MVDHNLTKMNQVEQYYVKKTMSNVKKLGYKYMVYQDPVDNGVKVGYPEKNFYYLFLNFLSIISA